MQLSHLHPDIGVGVAPKGNAENRMSHYKIHIISLIVNIEVVWYTKEKEKSGRRWFYDVNSRYNSKVGVFIFR